MVAYKSWTTQSLFHKDVLMHLLFGKSYNMHSSKLLLKVHFSIDESYFFRKVNEEWKGWLYFSCFIVVNHFTTVFCGLTGVQGYPMLSFLETDFQVTKKGEDQKLWRTQAMTKMWNIVIWREGMTWHTNNSYFIVWSCFAELPHSSAQ